jgi:hypothetical protein
MNFEHCLALKVPNESLTNTSKFEDTGANAHISYAYSTLQSPKAEKLKSSTIHDIKLSDLGRRIRTFLRKQILHL